MMVRLVAPLVVACLLVSFPTCLPAAEVIVPAIDGPWWTVAGDPDLGEFTNPGQQPVDFAIWQAADGTWQLWSCIRNTTTCSTPNATAAANTPQSSARPTRPASGAAKCGCVSGALFVCAGCQLAV